MSDKSNELSRALDIIKNLPPGDFLPSTAASDISNQIARLTRERNDLRNELARLANRFETFGRHIELSQIDRAAIERARDFLANADKETGG